MSSNAISAPCNTETQVWSRDLNTVYRIPAGTDVIMFFADDQTGEIYESDTIIQGPNEKVFNGTFLVGVERCECGCGVDLMRFFYATRDIATLFYQVNAQDVLVSTREEYEAQIARV